jgi:lactam utilization protein B
VTIAPSSTIVRGEALGIEVHQEIFADRGYTEAGMLIPRGQPGAMVPAGRGRRGRWRPRGPNRRGRRSSGSASAGVGPSQEIFADRGYTEAGMLIPRGQPGAMVTDPDEAAERVRTIRPPPAPRGRWRGGRGRDRPP